MPWPRESQPDLQYNRTYNEYKRQYEHARLALVAAQHMARLHMVSQASVLVLEEKKNAAKEFLYNWVTEYTRKLNLVFL